MCVKRSCTDAKDCFYGLEVKDHAFGVKVDADLTNNRNKGESTGFQRRYHLDLNEPKYKDKLTQHAFTKLSDYRLKQGAYIVGELPAQSYVIYSFSVIKQCFDKNKLPLSNFL